MAENLTTENNSPEPESIANTIDTVVVESTRPPVPVPERPPAPGINVAQAPMDISRTDKDNVAIIDSALTQFKNDRKKTAEFLGITVEQLKNKIHYSGALRAKWKLPRGEVNFSVRRKLLDIKPLSPNTSAAEAVAETVKSVAKINPQAMIEKDLKGQDNRLRKSMMRLGLTELEVIDAMASQQFHANHYASAVDITTAHTSINSIKIQGVLRVLESWITHELNAKLQNVDGMTVRQERKEEERRLKSVALIKTMLGGYTDLLKEARETAEMQLHGSVIKARLNEMAKRANVSTSTQAGKPKAGPGFGQKQKRLVLNGGTTNQIVTESVTINNPPPVAAPVVTSEPPATPA